VVTFFTAGPGSTTLPLYIYSSVKLGISPEIHALSTLMVGITILVLLLGTLFWKQRA
jgi:spermidine/putrescine transport system permease protein